MTARRRRSASNLDRLAGLALSIAVHVSIVVGLLSMVAAPPTPVEPIPVTMVSLEAPQLAPVTPVAPKKISTAKPQSRRTFTQPTPAAADISPRPALEAAIPRSQSGLSDAQLAGAASADSGPTGRTCDMARWVQTALRKDPLVQAAVAGATAKSMMVWNGDWIRNQGEDGKGLAAVREAIMWEIAFAPQACRAEPMHGLVLISLGQTPGSHALVVGSTQWRWSDLLTPRTMVSEGELASR